MYSDKEAGIAADKQRGKEVYRHKKRGSLYHLLALGTFVSIDPAKDDDDLYIRQEAPGIWHVRYAFHPQADGDDWARAQCNESIQSGTVVAIYQSMDDAMLWVRPLAEFNDGRFELTTSAPRSG